MCERQGKPKALPARPDVYAFMFKIAHELSAWAKKQGISYTTAWR